VQTPPPAPGRPDVPPYVPPHRPSGILPEGPGATGSFEVAVVLAPGAVPPAYAHPGDAGADLACNEDVTLAPGERRTVGTGVSIALPDGYAAFVHPRSGLAARHGLTIVNAPGTVDAGYRGEIRVTLLNTDSREPVALQPGDRIAQLVVQRVERVRFVAAAELPESVRGTGGFGSTGGFQRP
jgi:dUTP pyrophosphatase